jgi:queuosine precursor transporter
MRKWTWAFPAAYLSTILGANWAITRYGAIPVGFGLRAPAGVYFAGLAFTLRDLTQDFCDKRRFPWVTISTIMAGTACSVLVSPTLALASGTAFLLSEGADLAIYTPLKERSWGTALALSNTVGFVFDSVLFLWLAFRSLAFLPGQIVGKAWMTLVAWLVLQPYRRVRARVLV